MLQGIWFARADVGFDRPGSDYTKFVVKSGDPATCASKCDHEARCRAWSFSYPTPAGAPAICWLKNSIPARVRDDCCASGVRGAGGVDLANEVEFGIDRPGGDFRSFDTQPDSTGGRCAATCKAEQRCRAWTYVSCPGYEGSSARCVLKERSHHPEADAVLHIWGSEINSAVSSSLTLVQNVDARISRTAIVAHVVLRCVRQADFDMHICYARHSVECVEYRGWER